MTKNVNILMKQKSQEPTPEQLEKLLASLNIIYDILEDLPFTDSDGKTDEKTTK